VLDGVKRYLCFFFENVKTDLLHIVLGFRRKHLFITNCIEKHCSGPLTLSELFHVKNKYIILLDFLLKIKDFLGPKAKGPHFEAQGAQSTYCKITLHWLTKTCLNSTN